MKSTLTSKGQITIPSKIREKLRLRPGDVLDFDEEAPFLKATKRIAPEAWDEFSAEWSDPFPNQSADKVIEEWRGTVKLMAPISCWACGSDQSVLDHLSSSRSR